MLHVENIKENHQTKPFGVLRIFERVITLCAIQCRLLKHSVLLADTFAYPLNVSSSKILNASGCTHYG
uniref:Uncharacterized protein n=1 Tax=Rhizophora mucronata TaxID=61149 RepID=A0A2P2N1K6_RHIMU